MAVKTGSAPAKATEKSTAKPKHVMAFSFADTIAGYVKRYDRNADSDRKSTRLNSSHSSPSRMPSSA